MDPLKGKIFQSPQEGSSMPIQAPEAPSRVEAPEPQKPDQEANPEPLQAPVFQTEQTPQPPETPPSSSFQQSPSTEPDASSFSQPPAGNHEAPPPQEAHSNAPHFSGPNIAKLLIGIFAVLTIVFVVFSLVLPNLGKKEQKVDLTVWDIPDSLSIASVLPDFEKQNPNIQVTIVKQDIKDYKDKLITRSQNGNGPDLFRFNNTWVPELSNILLPIPSDVITRDTFDKTFYPVVKHDLVKNGAIYGIPVEINTLSLFINSAMLKQANASVPTNWNDFITTARSLTVKDQGGSIKTAGAAMGTFDNITHAPDIISMLMAQDGVNLDDISQTKDRVADALNFYTGFAIGDGSIWNATQSASLLAFSNGTLAMVFGYQKDLQAIKSANPNLSFEVHNVPYLTGRTQTIASYFPLGVSLRSRHQKEALLLLKFLSQKDVVSRLTSLPPARMDLPDKTNGQAKNAVSSYFAGETYDNGLNTQLNAHLSDAVNSVLSNNSADSAAQDLILGFSQVMGQFKGSQ